MNYRAKLWLPEHAAIAVEEACLLFCTQADAAELWGFSGSPEAVLQQMERRFSQSGASKTLVLTLGSEGSAQLQDGVYSSEPIIPTAGLARFGSGDAFAAGYIYAYLDGPHYQELHTASGITPLAFGNALAALKRCIAGDIAVITPADIKAVLRQNERFR